MLRVAALTVLLVLVTACSPSSSHSGFAQPGADSFRPGPCRAVAEAVLSVGKDSHAVAQGGSADAGMTARLKHNQDLIDAAKGSVDPSLKPSFSQLVIGIGVVRIRADSNTLEASVGRTALKDYEAVVSACTAPTTP